MNQYIKFLPYNKARKYVHKLNIKKSIDWWSYCTSGKKPVNIPSKPMNVYKGDWVNWAEWLGINLSSHKKYPFEKAQRYVRKLNFKTIKEYQRWKEKPYFLPRDLYHYKNHKRWKGKLEFLGINKKTFWKLEKSKRFTRKHGIKTSAQYYKFSATKKRPPSLPTNPAVYYKNKGWENWADFLGTKRTRMTSKNFRSFDQAKAYVSKLGIKNKTEYQHLRAIGKIPKDIPSEPHKIYQ